MNCSDGRGFAAFAASSRPGHVGARVSDGTLTGASLPAVFGANAGLSDSVTFTAAGGGAGVGPILVSFNFDFNGKHAVAPGLFDGASLLAIVNANGATVARLHIVDHGDAALFCDDAFNGVDCAEILSGRVVTDTFLVPLGVPISFSMSLEVLAFSEGAGASASAEFSNSLDIPVGEDVFNLPIGFTADAPDSLIIDNRFVPEPEPGLSAISGTAMLSMLVICRMRKRARSLS